MDEQLRERLKVNAMSYAKFLELEESEQEWLMPLLSRGTRSTIEILGLISQYPMTFEEIGNLVGCHATTVTQKLNALQKGGFGLELTESAAFAPTGRPRKLARSNSTNS